MFADEALDSAVGAGCAQDANRSVDADAEDALAGSDGDRPDMYLFDASARN